MLVFEKILKAYKADLSIKVIIMKIYSRPSICIRTLEKQPNACICICIPRFLVYLCCLKIDFAAVSLVLVLFLCIILFIYKGLYGTLGIYIYWSNTQLQVLLSIRKQTLQNEQFWSCESWFYHYSEVLELWILILSLQWTSSNKTTSEPKKHKSGLNSKWVFKGKPI